MAEEQSRFNATEVAVLLHPTLFEPKPVGKKGKASGPPKYSASFLLDPDGADYKALRAMAAATAKAKWPGRDLNTLKWPWSDGSKLADKRKAQGKEDGEFQRGKKVLVARSKYEPRLAVIEAGRIKDLDGPARAAAKAKFFFGAEVLYEVAFQAYDGVEPNPDGVNAFLNIVVATGGGKRMAGTGTSAAEAFKGYAGSATTEDPTDGPGDDW
jgi:hypothetical protein